MAGGGSRRGPPAYNFPLFIKLSTALSISVFTLVCLHVSSWAACTFKLDGKCIWLFSL